MAQHHLTGAAGEQLACQHLVEQGYTLLHRNWRHGRGELDLVMRQANALVVVEVKTRSTSRHGDPEEAVDPRKQRELVRAAEAYVDLHGLDLDIRFDIVSVVIEATGRTEIFHIPEAFYPTPQDEAIEE
jgi:putative endonuclease